MWTGAILTREHRASVALAVARLLSESRKGIWGGQSEDVDSFLASNGSFDQARALIEKVLGADWLDASKIRRHNDRASGREVGRTFTSVQRGAGAAQAVPTEAALFISVEEVPRGRRGGRRGPPAIVIRCGRRRVRRQCSEGSHTDRCGRKKWWARRRVRRAESCFKNVMLPSRKWPSGRTRARCSRTTRCGAAPLQDPGCSSRTLIWRPRPSSLHWRRKYERSATTRRLDLG